MSQNVQTRMNYLGHLALSFPDAHLMMGNFIADSLKPQERNQLESNVLRGVWMHYSIDRYVDQHEAFRSSLDILRDRHGKYAPVVLDIINDYFLTVIWDEFSNVGFARFQDEVYDKLSEMPSIPFERAGRTVSNLLNYRYLHAYSSLEGLSDVLRRMDSRSRFPSNFENALKDIDTHHNLFVSNFKILFEDTRGYLTDWVPDNE